MTNLIENKLHVSIGLDAINGDDYERGVMRSQCIEAVSTIIFLRREVDRLQAELDEMRQDRATMTNPVQDSENGERTT